MTVMGVSLSFVDAGASHSKGAGSPSSKKTTSRGSCAEYVDNEYDGCEEASGEEANAEEVGKEEGNAEEVSKEEGEGGGIHRWGSGSHLQRNC